MKSKNKFFTVAAVLSLLTLADGSLQAQVTNLVTISGTALLQGDTTNNGTISTTAAPIKYAVSTKTILAQLATDENAAGNYPTNVFPSGAKLVAIVSPGSGFFNNADFQVLDKTNKLLVDVSDILSASQGNNLIYSGKSSDATQLSSPTQNANLIVFLTYDDSGSTGALEFQIGGLMAATVSDTTPNVITGVYTETQSAKIAAMAGEGTADGNPFVFSGNLTFAGKGTLTLP